MTLFSRDRGRISAIARGSRRITSSISGATELCSYSTFQMATGTHLDVVTQAELKNAFLGLRSSLERVSRAVYILQFTAEFLEDRQPQPDLFLLLLSALYVMEKCRYVAWPLLGFELQAMGLLGYAPEFDSCVACGTQPGSDGIRFSASQGGILCVPCQTRYRDSIGISSTTLDAVHRLSQFELAALGAEEPVSGVLAEAQRVLRAHIRYHAEKEMKSARFIDQLRAEGSTL